MDLSLDDIIKNKKKVQPQNSSLDDIIKKKNIKFNDPKARKDQNDRPQNTRKFETAITKRNITTDLRNKIPQQNDITDVRTKLIQKKKLKMVDAREQIRPLGGRQQPDVRDRLNKIKKGNVGVAASRLGGAASRLGGATSRLGGATSRLGGQVKTAPLNRRPSSNRPMGVVEPRYQNVRRQEEDYEELDMSPEMEYEDSYPQEPIYRQERPVVVKQIYQPPPPPPTREVVYVDQYGAPIRERPMYVDEYGAPINERPVYADEYDAPVRERTVYVDEYGNPIRTVEAPVRRPPPVRVVQARPLSSYAEAPVRRMASSYVEEPIRRSAPVRSVSDLSARRPLSTGLAARMDQQPSRPSIYAKMRQQQPQPQRGTKLVVNNLNPAVSQEDVEELFETIGKTLKVKMLRKGVAEVVFKSREDALKSVKVFNNRELDGQPMTVRIVNQQ